MENSSSLIWIIIGMAFVTYLPRMLPMVYLTDKQLPDWLNQWLGYIPVTVLAALLAPILFINDQKINTGINVYLVAAIPAFIVGYYTKNIFITVLVGMGSVVGIRYVANTILTSSFL